MWDYPRPPRLEPTAKRLVVEVGGVVVADTVRGFRVLEASQPPAYYFPPQDCAGPRIEPSARRSFCEWKGEAQYWSVRVGDRLARDAAWSYAHPTAAFAAIAGYLSFYPARVDACFVEGERVAPMEGDFYGGWITADIVGPFKGAPGTLHW